MQTTCNQNLVVLWHYAINVVTPELKTDFSYIKTLTDILSCLHQGEYLIYCLKTIHLNWISPYLIDAQLYEYLCVEMLDRNRLHIKTNRNERPGPCH